jgi:hypothetical protein
VKFLTVLVVLANFCGSSFAVKAARNLNPKARKDMAKGAKKNKPQHCFFGSVLTAVQ